MYQKTQIIGRVGNEVALRYTPEGTPVATFSVATSRRWTDAQGEKHEKTTWFKVSAWRALGDACGQYLKKGQLCFVEGELSEPKPYQARDGEWRSSLELTATVVKFIGGRAEGEAQPAQTQAAQRGATVKDIEEEELPF